MQVMFMLRFRIGLYLVKFRLSLGLNCGVV